MNKPNAIVLFFSRSGQNYVKGELVNLEEGNSKKAARFIAKAVKADLFEIEPEIPYPDDYQACVERAKKELQTKTRPKLKHPLHNEDIEQYSDLFLVAPIWMGYFPMPVYSQLELLNLISTRVHVLASHEGSGLKKVYLHLLTALPACYTDPIAILGYETQDKKEFIEQWAKSKLDYEVDPDAFDLLAHHPELAAYPLSENGSSKKAVKESRKADEKRLEKEDTGSDSAPAAKPAIKERKDPMQNNPKSPEEIRVDQRKNTDQEREQSLKKDVLLFQFNQMAPDDSKREGLLKELFASFGAQSRVRAPLYGVCLDMVNVGSHCSIMFNCLMMARGGIVIEDRVSIAANVQLITNNHDPYIREILLCKPIHIKEGAWIGAGATILPGVTIGKYAIVGADSLVNKDVPDYAVVVGNPARVIKTLDPKKFEAQ